MKHVYLIIFLSLSLFAQAQNEECGIDHLYKQLMTDSLFIKEMIEQDLINQQHNADFDGEIIYVIPVVVHVIHTGEPLGVGSNIPNSQVYDAIQAVNDRYSNTIGFGLDVKIQFCLAERDPSGNATNGIDRQDGSIVPGYEEYGVNYFDDDCNGGPSHFTLAEMYHWPVDDYYNMYVFNMFDCGDGGLAGFAYYPSIYVTPYYDGAYFRNSSFTETSTTPTHELGHALNVMHTFNGDAEGASCPEDDDCSVDGDKVCDTPPHKRSNCSDPNTCSEIEPFTNSKNNYLSYCSLRNRFTAGQSERMHSSLLYDSRKNLTDNPWVCDPYTTLDISLTSDGCNYINEATTEINFLLHNECDSVINYAELNIYADDVFFDLIVWTGELLPGESIEISYSIIVPGGSSYISINCWSPNEINHYDKDPLNDKILFTVFPYSPAICENFSGDYLSNGWVTTASYPYVNFNVSSFPCKTNTLHTEVPSCLFGFYDSTAVNTLSKKFNFLNALDYADIILSFDRANKNDNNDLKTTRLIVTGTSCNSMPDTLLNLEGAALATTAGNIPICNYWDPNVCSDWDPTEISLCQYMGEVVDVDFNVLSQYYSGNVYFDNICLEFIAKPETEDTIVSCNDTVFLSANTVSGCYWSIISGIGGTVFNISDPNSGFSGIAGHIYRLSWNYMNACGALFSDTIIVELQGPSDPVIIYDATYCEGDTIQLLTPFNPLLDYYWSGPDDFISSDNDPSIENATIANSGIYSLYVINDNACSSDLINFEITVFPVPALPVISGTEEICEESEIALNTIFDSDYNYYWTGPLGDFIADENLIILSASEADEGTYYLFVEENGCISDTNNIYVTVNPIPVSDIILTGDSIMCEGDSLILEAAESGLNYTWSTGDTMQSIIIFDEDAYQLIVEDSLGCTNTSDIINVVVNVLPVVAFNIPKENICINDDPLELVFGSPIGGIYSGDGVVGNFFYPDLAGIGLHSITYSFTNINDCTNSVSDLLEVVELPIIEFELPFDSVCSDSKPVLIDFGLPTGGTYNGDGVVGDYFDPSLTDLGLVIIYYLYTDSNNCSNTDSITLLTYECEKVDVGAVPVDDPLVIIAPNPNNGEYLLSVYSPWVGELQIVMYDVLGEILISESEKLTSNVFQKSYNIPGISPGTYFLKLFFDNGVVVKKIIIDE